MKKLTRAPTSSAISIAISYEKQFIGIIQRDLLRAFIPIYFQVCRPYLKYNEHYVTCTRFRRNCSFITASIFLL
jgi:hypothetical protein